MRDTKAGKRAFTAKEGMPRNQEHFSSKPHGVITWDRLQKWVSHLLSP